MPKVGDRVALAPFTDAFMQGDKWGEVVKIGRRWVHVHMERSGHTLRMFASSLHDGDHNYFGEEAG